MQQLLKGVKQPSFLKYLKRSKNRNINDPFPSAIEIKQLADRLTETSHNLGKPSKSLNQMFVSRNFSSLSETITPITKEIACKDVQMRIFGTAGVIELDRPSKLNTLTIDMIDSITKYIQVTSLMNNIFRS